VFDVLRKPFPDDDNDILIAIANERESALLRGLESVQDRGKSAAQFLQFTLHGQFHMDELNELQHIDQAALGERIAQHTRDKSLILNQLPVTARDHVAHASLAAVSSQPDGASWKEPVEPANAERPITLIGALRPRALRDYRLANGLRVIMLPEAREPVFEARLVFPVGAGERFADHGGVPRAAAALLAPNWRHEFTPHERQTVEWVYRLGAEPHRWVDDTYTRFSISGLSLYADAHLWRLHWLLENGLYKADLVDEHKADLARDLQHDAVASGRAHAIRAVLFGPDHPYTRNTSVAAQTADAAELRKATLEQFRDQFYRAPGAVLILVGRFDPDEMTTQVNDLFGAWPAAPPPATAAVPAMRPPGQPTWLVLPDHDANQVRVTYWLPVASSRTKARAARAIVTEILNDHLAELRSQAGASYGVAAEYATSAAGDVLEISGFLDPARAGDAIRRLQDTLARLRAGDDLAADFVRARRHALLDALADPTRTSVAADQIEAAITAGLPADAAQTLPAELAATTLADLRAVLAQDLALDHMVVLVSGQPADTVTALATAGVTGAQAVADGAQP
jgi:predicted Zn-dependent peptidase